MSSQGTILARVYTSGAQLPLSGVPVSFAQVLPDGRRYCVTVLVTDSPADDAANAAVIAAISKRIYEHFTEDQ